MDLKVLIREKNKQKVQSLINNSANPTPSSKCTRRDCLPCTSKVSPNKQTNGNCWQSGIVYKITCLPCQWQGNKAQYFVESGRSSFCRGLEHTRSLEKGTPGKPLPDHNLTYHPGMKMDQSHFRMEQIETHRQPLRRILSEGLQIEKLIEQRESGDQVIVLNSKTNFFQPGTIRLRPTAQEY